MQLWHKVTLGLVLGIVAGIFLPQEFGEYVKPIGTIFLRLIKMITTPLIFLSLISGITSMGNSNSLGRIGVKSAIAFLITTFFAVLFGIAAALILKPGVGVEVTFDYAPQATESSFNLKNFLIEMIPDNAIGALASGNTIQVVFFAIFAGAILNTMGAASQSIIQLIRSMTKLVFKMIGVIVRLSPYAAFALTTWVVATQGVDVLLGLSKLVVAVVIAMIFQYIVFGLMIVVFCRISPIPFYKKSLHYQVLAFSTCSSKATLPTTMTVCREEMGISSSSTSFVLPLGAAINMDGFAINLSLTTLFFAQMLGIELQMHDYLMIIFTTTVGSIGGAGIPGASLIMLPMVLSSVNIPTEGVAILAGVDRVLDMLRTAINITGDVTVTMMVDCSEGTFDKERYES